MKEQRAVKTHHGALIELQNSSYYVNRALSNFGGELGEEKFALATKELHKTRPERTTSFILISCFNSTTWASSMVIRVVELSSGGTKLKRFLPKNRHTQKKFLNFENWCQKLDIILVIKWFKNWCYQKMVFFYEKKRNIGMIFEVCINLKVKFWHFLTPPHHTNSQNSIIIFRYVDS